MVPIMPFLTLLFHSTLAIRRVVMPKTALSAELEDWKETNFEADIEKLQKEAEERLDEKITELTANIAKTGAEN